MKEALGRLWRGVSTLLPAFRLSLPPLFAASRFRVIAYHPPYSHAFRSTALLRILLVASDNALLVGRSRWLIGGAPEVE